MGLTSIIIHSSQDGYPAALFYAVGLIGLVLLFVRPYGAFLFATFCLAARNFQGAVFTRVPSFGAYLNLNDLLMWICLFAMLRIAIEGQTLWAPKILVAILAINFLGALDAIFQYGLVPEVLRTVWAAGVFPLMFLVGANLVINQKKSYYFYWALFGGALVAALQHLVFIKQQAIIAEAETVENAIRSISYIVSGGLFLVISGMFIKGKQLITRRVVQGLWFVGLACIALSYLLSLTRTVWVGAVAAIVGVFLITATRQNIGRFRLSFKIISSACLIIATLVIIRLGVFPSLNVGAIVEKRMGFVQHERVFDRAYGTREQGLKTEMKIWEGGSLIWGVGTTLPRAYWQSSAMLTKHLGAIRHVGFASYLASFGLLGLLVYWVWLPGATILTGRRLFLVHQRDYVGALALAAMALSLYDFVTIFSSNHYLWAIGQVNGLIYGAVWGLSRAHLPDFNPLNAVQPSSHLQQRTAS